MSGAYTLYTSKLDFVQSRAEAGLARLSHVLWAEGKKKPARRIRAVAPQQSIPSDIPAPLMRALTPWVCKPSLHDGPHALIVIRNAPIHADMKRGILSDEVSDAVCQQANVWRRRYLELCFLHLFAHQGEYRHAVSAVWRGEVERVPWAR